jgi:hypothetical protein
MGTEALPVEPALRTSSPRLLGVLLIFVLATAVGSVGLTVPFGDGPATQPRAFVGRLFAGAALGQLVALAALWWLLRRRGLGLGAIGLGRPTSLLGLTIGVAVGIAYAGLTALSNPVVAAHVLVLVVAFLQPVVKTVIIP